MNTTLLKQHISNYKNWHKSNKSQASKEQQERVNLAIGVQSFNKELLLSMTKDEFYDYIAPLWAMVMWGNKHYQVDNIIEANGLPLLREQFANLIWGTTTIEKRWDEFRSKIKGVGPAIMSELLCKTHPNEFLIWNKKTYNGFQLLEIPDLPRYEARLTGKYYTYLSTKGKELLSVVRENKCPEITDMLTLNSFIWQELQTPISSPKEKDIKDELLPQNTKEALFIHNDIRDKLAEIGCWLGFNAEIEKKVAAGAVVDTVWEVTIGNMGRVIYAFEVQTSGSIDSLILNLMKVKNNKAVQGIVAVTDQKQIEKIKREIGDLNQFNGELKFWDYAEVLKVHESLQYVNESINNLGLVPLGL